MNECCISVAVEQTDSEEEEDEEENDGMNFRRNKGLGLNKGPGLNKGLGQKKDPVNVKEVKSEKSTTHKRKQQSNVRGLISLHVIFIQAEFGYDFREDV